MSVRTSILGRPQPLPQGPPCPAPAELISGVTYRFIREEPSNVPRSSQYPPPRHDPPKEATAPSTPAPHQLRRRWPEKPPTHYPHRHGARRLSNVALPHQGGRQDTQHCLHTYRDEKSMNEIMSGYSTYTSAAAYSASLVGEAPATTSAPCAVTTIIILTAGQTC